MSKQCLLCGEDVGVDIATCPNDGEASWGPSVEEPKSEVKPAEPKAESAKKSAARK